MLVQDRARPTLHIQETEGRRWNGDPTVYYGNSDPVVVALRTLCFIYLSVLSIILSALKGSEHNCHFHVNMCQISIDFPNYTYLVRKEHIFCQDPQDVETPFRNGG